MKFDVEIPTCREGVFVPARFAGPEQIVDLVKHAEALGYHAVWATDFVTPSAGFGVPDAEPPSWYEPLVTLAYAAARTERIKLGTGVIVLPYREPVILAKQVATLDRCSGGRLLLGCGLGAFRDEFDALRPATRKAHRGRMMDEYLEVLHALLDPAGGAVSYQGQYVALDGVRLDPKPVQARLPVYLPIRGGATLERAMRFAHGCMFAASSARERISEIEAAGRDPAGFDLVGEGELCLGETREAAIAAYRASRMGRFRTRRVALETVVEQQWIGTPEQVAEKIQAAADLGLNHFNVLHIAGDTLSERLRQMQTFASDVMARFD